MKRNIDYITFFSLLFLSLLISSKIVHADYTISQAGMVQYRVYEDGRKQYLLYFNVVDSGEYVTEDVVTKVLLKDPNGLQVNISQIIFSVFNNYMRAYFDATTAQWIYPSSPIAFGEWRADINSALFTGEYTVEITTNDMQIHTVYADFEHFEIPIISSKTFQINTDSDGNIYWTWNIPKSLLNLGKTYNMLVRAGIGSYTNDKINALIYVDTPIYMGSCFVPYDKLQYLRGLGNEIRFYLDERTPIAYNRSYSNSIKITDFSSPLEITPKKNAVIIPLN